MRKFYASYRACLRGYLDRQSNPAKQEPLTHVRVLCRRVDISLPTIHRFLYGVDTNITRDPLNLEFDYCLKLIKEGHFQRDKVVRETTKRWIDQHISLDREGADQML